MNLYNMAHINAHKIEFINMHFDSIWILDLKYESMARP